MVAFGIPSILIKQTEGGLFSGGGEQIKQAKLVYQERTTIERMILVETLQMLVSKMAKPVVLVQELLVTEKKEEDVIN
jgi:1,4-dihydroxy-2-naphthoyl-CoA synthase